MNMKREKSRIKPDKKELEPVDYPDTDNLGLDADCSSVNPGRANYNNDNDRISHNPDGEDDSHDTKEMPGHSPLADK